MPGPIHAWAMGNYLSILSMRKLTMIFHIYILYVYMCVSLHSIKVPHIKYLCMPDCPNFTVLNADFTLFTDQLCKNPPVWLEVLLALDCLHWMGLQCIICLLHLGALYGSAWYGPALYGPTLYGLILYGLALLWAITVWAYTVWACTLWAYTVWTCTVWAS